MLSEKEIQHKINHEIIVDCYDEFDVSTAWHCFIEERLRFPFKATAKLKKRDGRIEKKEVKVVGLADNEEGFMNNDFYLEIETRGQYISIIPYSKSSNIKASPEILEAFVIWDYWIRR